ncbi:ABC-type amino acid transport, signal transduction system, periplasmic component [Aquitalea magnusonii]|jgi:polar amino acid transport system substrate-binding protein|uniref:ABC-type amino acid transport, signal transduction system, periplasmic component n=1 Tax=Aquitalea magnusonii TaxID=332411 RepID=A0A3G9GFX6_9NEIS|nr:transporter substrate-binding domain-containing protein [Aquitalea magnusonii]BBF85733.1 ABC-type amino acid transport, signal transduction system, periplasmic component [Aquitalea magnusonii]
MAALPHRLLPGLLLTACLAQAAESSRVIDLECDYLPNICNRPGESSPGMMIEIGSEAIRRAGFMPRTKIRPWNRAMREVIDRPNAVIIYFARTPEREALFRWIAITNTTDFRFFSKDGSAPCNTLQQALAAGLIGVRSGSSALSWLAQQGIDSRRLEQSQLPEMAKMLKAGRIGSFLGASITFRSIYQQETGTLPVEGKVVYSSQSWMASGPRFPADTAARIAAALNRMKQEGFVDQVMHKYGR